MAFLAVAILEGMPLIVHCLSALPAASGAIWRGCIWILQSVSVIMSNLRKRERENSYNGENGKDEAKSLIQENH